MSKRKHLVLISAAMGGAVGCVVALGLFLTFGRLGSLAPINQARAEESTLDPYVLTQSIQDVFRLISAEILPSIVEVSVKSESVVFAENGGTLPWDDFFANPSEESNGPRHFQSQGLGSGVIVERSGDDYYVLTNSHVVGTATEINVLLSDGRTAIGELVGRDERKDLAVLRFEHASGDLSVIRFGDSDRLYVGDWVLAFGSPYGYEQSVSLGIVSALGRRDGPSANINDFIQTDASINQGNSGGALVNTRGELVGINTFITTPNRGSIGLGFAIPVNNALSAMRQIIDYGEVRYGWLGVSLGAYGPESAESLGYELGEGVLVYQVYQGSPAATAGLLPGDLIVTLDGRPAEDNERLVYWIGEKAPGNTAVFGIKRGSRPLVIEAEMGKRAEEDEVRAAHNLAQPGFVAAPMTEDLRETMNLPEDIRGIPVAEVYPRTSAQAVDLRPGDIITAVDGRPVINLADLYRTLGPTSGQGESFTVWRNGGALRLERNP